MTAQSQTIEIDMELPCNPRGKQRPRVVNGKAYTPKETRGYEDWIRLHAHNAMRLKGYETLDGPLEMQIDLYFTMPVSWNAQRQKQAKAEWWVVGRVDLDNAVKAVCDALNGICYRDDAQIAVLHASKSWGHYGKPSLAFTLSRL